MLTPVNLITDANEDANINADTNANAHANNTEDIT